MKDKESIEYRPIVIPKETIDTFLKQDDPFGLIAVYTFLYYTAVWQKTNKAYAKTCYIAKGLKISQNRVRKIRRALLELGYIKDIVIRKENGRIWRRYIKVKYYLRATTLTKLHTHDNQQCGVETTNTYSDSKKNTYSNRSRDQNPDRKIFISSFDCKAANKLHKIILAKKSINHSTTKWPDIFRKLRKVNKVPKERIKEVLLWYGRNIGEEFVPVAHSASTFREKFSRIEDAMQRQKRKKIKEEEDENPCEYRMGADGEMGFYAKDE